MILLLLGIGIVDSLPPLPDPYQISVESLPAPQIEFLPHNFSITGHLNNPYGGIFSYYSPYGKIGFKYLRGDDWFEYSDFNFQGAILIPIKKTMTKLYSSYLYHGRIDTINNLKNYFSLTTVNDFILSLESRYDYNSVGDTTIDEYSLAPEIIFKKLPLTPKIKADRTKSAFSDFWGVEIGSRISPFIIIGEYRNHNPGFRVRLDYLYRGIRSGFEIERTTRALFLRDILEFSPVLYSDSIHTARKRIGLSSHLGTNHLKLHLHYRYWDSLPTPREEDLYGIMAPAKEFGGMIQIMNILLIDSTGLFVDHYDQQYRSELSAKFFISAIDMINFNLEFQSFEDFKFFQPGFSIKRSIFEVGLQYYPSTEEIYPHHFLKERYLIFLKLQGSFQ